MRNHGARSRASAGKAGHGLYGKPWPAGPAILAFLAVLLPAVHSLAGSATPETEAVLTARFDPERHAVSGTALFTMVNVTARPLEEILVNVYANRLLRPNPALNDVNYSWSYPRSFDPGYMDVTRFGIEGGGARAGAATFVERNKRPRKTLLRVALAAPLPPGERARISMDFTTFVPRKYGSFGRYDGAYLLNGGWYPYLPPLDPESGWIEDGLPPAGRFRLVLEKPARYEAVVNGRRFRRGEPARFEGEARFLSVALAGTFHEYLDAAQGAEVSYLRLDSSEGSGRRVTREAARVLSFHHERYGAVKGVRIVLLEGHFRNVLSDHGDGMCMLSDRILRVLPYPVDLRKYHLREVAFEVLYMLAVRETRRREGARDWNWTAEAVAWARLREYLAWRDSSFDEVTDILNTFRFIPIIDQTVVAPRFPFNDVFFDTFFKSEALREGVLRYNNKIPFGRLMLEKARDVMGDEALGRSLDLWAKGGSLEEAWTRAGTADMGSFVEQWRGGYPLMNYRVGKVKEEKLGEGRFRITTEIFRTGGDEGFEEIAELGVVCESGRRFLARVPVSGGRTLDSWVYPEPWDKVIVDPLNRIRESNKTDNRVPRKPRILVTAFNPRLEWELETPIKDSKLDLELFGGFAGILEGDYANQVHLTYFYNRRGVGSSLGYYRAFNMKLDRTDFRQGLGAFFFLERLHQEFALADGEEGGGEENLVVTSFLLYYTVDTRIDQKNPHSGAAARISLEVAEMVFGTDFSFKRLFWDLRWIYAPIREHILAFQTEGGLSWGQVPAQRRFSAGGFFGVRGVPEREALGTQSLVFRWEYRHMMWHDLNLNFFWFGWIRKVQGVLFMETGAVTGKYQDLFRTAGFRSGTGYGIRLEFDSFGVRPFLVGLDVGWRLDEIGDPPIFYLTVSQSF